MKIRTACATGRRLSPGASGAAAPSSTAAKEPPRLAMFRLLGIAPAGRCFSRSPLAFAQSGAAELGPKMSAAASAFLSLSLSFSTPPPPPGFANVFSAVEANCFIFSLYQLMGTGD